MNLKELRQKANKTQTDVADYLGLSYQAYAHYEAGRREPDYITLVKLANLFNVTTDFLLGKEERFTPSNIYLPEGFVKMKVIGNISAGYDGQAVEEELDEFVVLAISLRGFNPEDCFLLKVKGDSMYPAFQDKDLVLIHRQSSVDSGETAVILYNGDEATLKKVVYKKGENWLELIPRNPEYKTKRIENADLEQCRVLGKVISLVNRDIF